MSEILTLSRAERKQLNFQPGELKKCAECKKRFYIPRGQTVEYAYKKKRPKYGREKFYCSWSCYRSVNT